jgi:hypothetical protein
MTSRYWAVTGFVEDGVDVPELTLLMDNYMIYNGGYVRYCLISQVHDQCSLSKHPIPHYHVLIYLDRDRRKSALPTSIKKMRWVSPLRQKHETLEESIRSYIRYIKNKGSNFVELGEFRLANSSPRQARAKSTRTKSEEVFNMIQEGVPPSGIVAKYPSMVNQIKKLNQYRPGRETKTYVLWIQGETGIGKTTNLLRTLKALEVEYEIPYYWKVNGFSKWWEGYDNQPICVIDDPVTFKGEFGENESKQVLKTVLSLGPSQIEIKFGNMQFTSHLVIILANMGPTAFAVSCGNEIKEAIYRRLTDTVPPMFVTTIEMCREYMPQYVLEAIKRIWEKVFDIRLDKERVLDMMEPVETVDFSNMCA